MSNLPDQAFAKTKNKRNRHNVVVGVSNFDDTDNFAAVSVPKKNNDKKIEKALIYLGNMKQGVSPVFICQYVLKRGPEISNINVEKPVI